MEVWAGDRRRVGELPRCPFGRHGLAAECRDRSSEQQGMPWASFPPQAVPERRGLPFSRQHRRPRWLWLRPPASRPRRRAWTAMSGMVMPHRQRRGTLTLGDGGIPPAAAGRCALPSGSAACSRVDARRARPPHIAMASALQRMRACFPDLRVRRGPAERDGRAWGRTAARACAGFDGGGRPPAARSSRARRERSRLRNRPRSLPRPSPRRCARRADTWPARRAR